MANEIRSKLIRIGLIDPKLSELAFFEIDLNNIMPVIRQARVWYMRHFMAAGPFRRQPVINVIFELPDGSRKYVRSWAQNEGQPRKMLELNREAINNPQQLICEILRTWNECEKVWMRHIEDRIKEFEKSLLKEEVIVPRVLQFNRR